MSIRTDIQSRRDTYPPSMRRVADAILDRPQLVLDQTITELARVCSTSETSVVRFCRTIGFAGYAPMRIAMATELATEAAQFDSHTEYGSDITRTDTLAETVAKISQSEILGIRETASALDLDALQRIVDRISAAATVLTFGVAASNTGARDLAQKLLRVGTVAVWSPDAHDALVPATILGPDGVAIGFSHSGRTRESVEFLRAARNSGAFTVAITNSANSPIAEQADETLHTAVRETTFRSGAMASRIAQLTLVDYLFVGVARSDYDRSVEAIRKTHDSARTLRGRS